MNREVKTCQNCKKEFTIEPDDFSFYEKMRVPPPTWCPDCRLMRKMVWRNERTLYRRTCDLCSKSIISIYPSGVDFPVYCQECWWSDRWNPEMFGRSYDFNKSFFSQFSEFLLKRVPAMALFNTTAVNADYCNYMAGAKNCYLLMGGRESEDILYSNRIYMSKDGMDLYTNTKTEACYESVQCENSYGLKFCQYCDGCSDSSFLYNCKGCQNCFGSVNLRNKQHYFLNQPCTKEQYQEKIAKIDLGNRTQIEEWKTKFSDLKKNSLHKYAEILKSVNCTGDNLKNSKNCHDCFDFSGDGYENSRFSHYIGLGLKDSYDIYGLSRGELLYESLSLGFESTENSRYVCSQFIKGSSDIFYSYNCTSSQNLFGCYGLRGKQYCVLNKQYTREEYEKLVPQVIQHMKDMPYVDQQGRTYGYGEFFPLDLSPFAYNETIAEEYFSLTKEGAVSRGYRWKEPEGKNYQITKKSSDLPDGIKDIDDSIMKETIGCAHEGKCKEQCTIAFKIIPQELQFYRRMNLSLPTLCPNCRHYERLRQRNPLKLWHRKCQCGGIKSENGVYTNTAQHGHGISHCQGEFETPYAPERKEIVYCESCYQAEVV
jgi:hypothetical protein